MGILCGQEYDESHHVCCFSDLGYQICIVVCPKDGFSIPKVWISWIVSDKEDDEDHTLMLFVQSRSRRHKQIPDWRALHCGHQSRQFPGYFLNLYRDFVWWPLNEHLCLFSGRGHHHFIVSTQHQADLQGRAVAAKGVSADVHPQHRVYSDPTKDRARRCCG